MPKNQIQWTATIGPMIAALFITSEVNAVLLIIASFFPEGMMQFIGILLAFGGTLVFFLWLWRWIYRSQLAVKARDRNEGSL